MTTAAELSQFTRIIEHRLGLRIEPDRAIATGELIARRARVHGEPIAAYLGRVDADPGEIRVLAGELTVGETYFFRHVEQFNAFADVVLPERLAERARVNVLSAGCSSGEEALTLAILARERVAEPGRIAIHAVDVNPAVLERAAQGRYSRWALRATPSETEARWFKPDGQDVILAPEIRGAVAFAERNLVADGDLWAPERWDAVFCRNAMMYFTESRAQELIARFARSLAPGGFLFLGHAETLRGRSDDFELCNTHGTFYYQRKPTSPARSARPPAPRGPEPAAPGDTRWVADIEAASSRIHAIVDGAQPIARPAPAPLPASLDGVRELFDQERFAEALACLAHLPAAIAAKPEAVLLRANVLAHTGRFADAEDACREMLARGASAGAHYVLALCRESRGDSGAAARHARLAGALDPTFAMPHVQLGLLARRTGELAVAATELARAIALLETAPAEHLRLYSGGFGRQALLDLCRAELAKAAS